MTRILLLLLAAIDLWAQPRWFAGAGPGLALLSGDAASNPSAPGGAAVSFYDVKNAPIVHAFLGGHLHDYLSVQGAYSWNRNDVTITESLAGPRPSFRERATRMNEHQAAADLLLYFRDRQSWARPHLSVGIGATRFTGFDATKVGLRVAAGIDLVHNSGWGFRYCFLETISGNPISESMNPPGRKKLMTFQNLFGLLKYW